MVERHRLDREREIYDSVSICSSIGELDVFDEVILSNIIRQPEIQLITDELEGREGLFLDFGCGPGWLSKLLSEKGFQCVGIDISKNLCMAASQASPRSSFLIGNCARLPFRDCSFEAILGIAILHHLDLMDALRECRRVAKKDAVMIFFEPNTRNPLTRIANKRQLLETHTPDEKPLDKNVISEVLRFTGWHVIRINFLFPLGFAFSYLFHLIDPMRTNQRKARIARYLRKIDKLIEQNEALSQFGSTIVFIAYAV